MKRHLEIKLAKAQKFLNQTKSLAKKLGYNEGLQAEIKEVEEKVKNILKSLENQ